MTCELIKQIDFVKYKKLNNLKIELSPGINIIMGNNGTGKTTLLHVIANTYKFVPAKNSCIRDENVMKQIRSVNHMINPKMESLYRVSQASQNEELDPGTLYKCTLENRITDDKRSLNFRKHDSDKKNRLRIIPKYQKQGQDFLPEALVIYLGLSRLHAFGEYEGEEISIKTGKNNRLPEEITHEIQQTYADFTNIKIIEPKLEDMGKIKKRTSFVTKEKNIDSNTISAGQDNLLIILTAIYSVKYFLEQSNNELPGILLIDEIENSLHPEFQIKLLNLLQQIANENPSFQTVFTTHSFEIMEEALSSRYNLIYLLNNGDSVALLNEPDVDSIKGLMTKNNNRIIHKNIPYLVEDNEADGFLKSLLRHIEEKDDSFKNMNNLLDRVEASFSSNALKNLFNNKQLPLSSFHALGFLDGDQKLESEISNRILVLPGGKPPEQVAYDTMKQALNQINDNPDVNKFFQEIAQEYYLEGDDIHRLITEFEAIDDEIESISGSTKGVRRSKIKKWYNNNPVISAFFDLWPLLEDNKEELNNFEKKLRIVYRKIGPVFSIKQKYWIDL